MPLAQLNDVEIEYEVYGSPAGEPLLLVHGLGAQLTGWPQPFVEALVARGFYVVVYDNRDVGLSTKFHDWGPADIAQAFRQARAHETVDAPYTAEDMADDGINLLGVLGIDRAHVLGSSNGGAIAQLMAIRHAGSVATMVSMMATSGRRGLPRPTKEADAWLAQPRNPDGSREGAVRDALAAADLLARPGFPRDDERVRRDAARAYDRCFNPAGNSRHLLASIASGDSRVERLADIAAPTLIVHGAEDPLVPLAQGEDVYRSINDAQMLVVAGMAHDIPEGAVAQIADAVLANARRSATTGT
jgi:pimeloyl-ACP methyl ester carboxylesterase